MSDLIISTTQNHLDIETITNDIAIMKDGSAVLILQVSAINFGLLSEEEQDATIYAYASLLNSLSFPIQIRVKSSKKDITQYLELLAQQEKKIKDLTLKQRMASYRKFIESTIIERQVLEKKFYVVIPYTPITLGKSPKINADLIKKALTDLEPKRNHLIKQFARIGLLAQQLNAQNLIKLFSSFYNPKVKGQRFSPVKDYEAPLVSPNIASKQTTNDNKQTTEN